MSIIKQSPFQAFMEDTDCDIDTLPPELIDEEFDDPTIDDLTEDDLITGWVDTDDEWSWLM